MSEILHKKATKAEMVEEILSLQAEIERNKQVIAEQEKAINALRSARVVEPLGEDDVLVLVLPKGRSGHYDKYICNMMNMARGRPILFKVEQFDAGIFICKRKQIKWMRGARVLCEGVVRRGGVDTDSGEGAGGHSDPQQE